MEPQKNLLIVLGEWLQMQQIRRANASQAVHSTSHVARWLPTRGNVIFTLAMIALLIAAQSVGALPLGRPLAAPEAASTGTIAYQGRLADAAGAPITDTVNMTFRLYTGATGGTPLWSEPWTGSNGVKVSDGLFNVMLGSLTALPQSAIAGRSQMFLGITVDTDDEMQPRVQLGSVPFAVQALTVPDGSVTTGKIANGAVTTTKLADKSVTGSKIDFSMPELYRPNLLGDGQCHDLIADLKAHGFKQCVYASSPGSEYVPWHYASDCSDQGTPEPSLWQKDGIWRMEVRSGHPVFIKGTYEDQMPYLVCAK